MFAEALAGCGLQVAQVGTGAERAAGTGDHDRADAVVGLERVHRRDNGRHHRRRERVALAGVVERQPADAVADVGDHERFCVHPTILAERVRSPC